MYRLHDINAIHDFKNVAAQQKQRMLKVGLTALKGSSVLLLYCESDSIMILFFSPRYSIAG